VDGFRELFGLPGELLRGRPFVGDFVPSEPDRDSLVVRDSPSPMETRSSGDPGTELDLTSSACGNVGLLLGLEEVAQVVVGDI